MRPTLLKILVMCASCVMLFASGCGTRVVMVPSGDPVRLAEPVRTQVWVKTKDGDWVKSSNKVTIAEGWYALSVPEGK